MRIFNVIAVAMFIVILVSCENSVRKSNDSSVTIDENQTADENLAGDEDGIVNDDTANDEKIQNDGDASNDENASDEIVFPDDDVSTFDDSDQTGQLCTENNNCGEKFYCSKDNGSCFSEGTCKEVPLFCDGIYEPVCGCDNNVYSNYCVANSSKENVFYSMNCLKELEKAEMVFSYTKEGLSPEKMTGETTFSFKSASNELLILSSPSVTKKGNISNVTVIFNGINGVFVTFKFAFQTDPFDLPQVFDLVKTGDNTAEVKTVFGTTVGFLTGKLTVTKYRTNITGKFESLEINAPELSFVQ